MTTDVLSPEELALARLVNYNPEEELPAANSPGLDEPESSMTYELPEIDLSGASNGNGNGNLHSLTGHAADSPLPDYASDLLTSEVLPPLAPVPDLGVPPLPGGGESDPAFDLPLPALDAAAEPEESAEPEEEEVADPRSVKTKVGIVNHPLSKLALIAGGGLLLFGSLGMFLSAVTGPRDTKQAIVPTASPSPQDPTLEGTDDSSKYKTEAAISAQKIGLSQMQPKPTPTPTAPAMAPKPVALAPAPAPITPLIPLSPTPTLLSPTTNAQQEKDPVQKWQEAAHLGSYGHVAMSGGSSSYNSTPVPVTPTPNIFTPAPSTVTSTSASGAQPLSSLRSASATPGLRDKPLAPVLVGSTAKAAFSTSIVLSGDNTTPADPTNPAATKYLVQLQADLKDADGNTALPKGAQLVVVTKSFSPQTGLAEFQVSGVIVNNREYSAPTGAMVIRNPSGGAIALSKQGGGSSFISSILPALFSGVSTAAQAINQPNSSSVVNSGSVSTTVTSSKPNVGAGFAQGFSQNLTQSLSQQVQATNQARQSQPNAWAIGAGTSVMLFVNSSFQM